MMKLMMTPQKMSHILVNQTRKRKLKCAGIIQLKLESFHCLIATFIFQDLALGEERLSRTCQSRKPPCTQRWTTPECTCLHLNAKSPLDMFMAHCGEETFELLNLESNPYRQQLPDRTRKCPLMSRKEIQTKGREAYD